jgi:hypothetical protein
MGTVSNVRVQPCIAYWDEDDLGFTEGDIEIETEEQAVDVTAHQEGTNVLDAIRTGKTVAITLTLKETSLAQLQALLRVGGGSADGNAQITTIAAVADSAGSLNNKFFTITGRDPDTKVMTRYIVWFNVNSAGTEPVLEGYTAVQVALATGATADAVADAIASALDALDEFASANPASNTVTVTHADEGVVEEPDAGNCGMTITVSSEGSSALVGWGKGKDFESMLVDARHLRLHPVALESDNLIEDVNFWKAYPMLQTVVQSAENPKTFSVGFRIFPDSTKDEEVRLWAVGDGS